LALWQRAIKHSLDIPLQDLAFRYRVGPGSIASATVSAQRLAAARGAHEATSADVVGGIRATIAERMGGLAHHVESTADWSELVLTTDTHDQVRGLLARVQHSAKVLDDWGYRARLPRGTGISALFSGPPGTGKTMVAGLIAKALDLELYQVDLSRVVSKWVGETEKQLAQIFDAAESGHALLLFDEADALFAKRTEVKAAVDRYANLEVNYLLQRIESFEGMAILTTNMDTSIDPALKRRLAAHIVFYPPDEEEREHLWAKMITSRTPTAGTLDFVSLARDFPDMTGAHIRNAAISGAFAAATEGVALQQQHLERAARLEYRSMGRVLGKR
jgi:SpoVK/Ycf46/Vps4 family AAA+-type ATPase